MSALHNPNEGLNGPGQLWMAGPCLKFKIANDYQFVCVRYHVLHPPSCMYYNTGLREADPCPILLLAFQRLAYLR